MFKKMRGIELPEEEQGYIYFVCLTHKKQSKETQSKILDLCLTYGAENWKALFDVVTTKKNMIQISIEHYVSESVLYRLRTKFYEAWWP